MAGMGQDDKVTPVPRMADRAFVTHLTPFLCPASRNASCSLLIPKFGDSFRIEAKTDSACPSARYCGSCPGSPTIRIRHVLSHVASNGLLSKSRCLTFTKSDGELYGSSGFCKRVAQQHVTNAASSVDPRIAESSVSAWDAPLMLWCNNKTVAPRRLRAKITLANRLMSSDEF